MENTYVNPLTDFGFKKIFGEKASKKHLIDFLNSILPQEAQIADLTFQNLEQLASQDMLRKAVYDIYCQGVDGQYFIVELQKVKQKFFKDRTVLYATYPIQQQAQKGEWDFELTPVYCISVLGFTFDDDAIAMKREEVLHKVQLKDQHNEVFYQKLTFIYLEIPNFKKGLSELETRLDKWLYFIKNLEDLQNIPELLKDEVFLSAFETARLANLSNHERQSYEYSLKVMRDNYATTKYAIEKAVEIAVDEARAVALLEGEQKAKLEVAKAMKAAGITPVQIQAITGLSATDLEKI
jgi:predicted transposase/invertase (TIGR01784 family)